MREDKRFRLGSKFNIVGMKYNKEGYNLFKKEQKNATNYFDLTLLIDVGLGVSVFYKDKVIGKIATSPKFLDDDDCSGKDVKRRFDERVTTKATIQAKLAIPLLNEQESIKVRVFKIFYPSQKEEEKPVEQKDYEKLKISEAFAELDEKLENIAKVLKTVPTNEVSWSPGGDMTITSHPGVLLSSGDLTGHYGYVNTNKKENKSMKNITSMFNKFGSDFNYNTSNFAISMFGGLAVKSGETFVTYDAEKNTAVDVMDFVIDGFSDMIMIMPTQKLEKGDIFIQNGKVYQMIGTKEFYSYTDGTISNLVEKKNIMGFQMYAKVFNIMSGFTAAEGENGNMFANPMFMMMMMKDGDGDMSNMMQMMMMSQMFQGGGFKF